MVSLWEWHCCSNMLNSDGAALILSIWNSNKESDLDFSIFSVFKQMVTLMAKILYLQLLIKHDWKGTGACQWAWGPFWRLADQRSYTIKSKIELLPMMPCEKCTLNLKKQHFSENPKKWLFSNHCLCCLVPCISLKIKTITVKTHIKEPKF